MIPPGNSDGSRPPNARRPFPFPCRNREELARGSFGKPASRISRFSSRLGFSLGSFRRKTGPIPFLHASRVIHQLLAMVLQGFGGEITFQKSETIAVHDKGLSLAVFPH